VVLAAAVVIFALGVALGEALHDSGDGGGSVTYDRTVTIPPERQTVTVTVSPG
jgi:precorrin-6B methylase 2